jgi:hypothetical protein
MRNCQPLALLKGGKREQDWWLQTTMLDPTKFCIVFYSGLYFCCCVPLVRNSPIQVCITEGSHAAGVRLCVHNARIDFLLARNSNASKIRL